MKRRGAAPASTARLAKGLRKVRRCRDAAFAVQHVPLPPATFPTRSITGQRFPPALAGNKEPQSLSCETQGGPTVLIRNGDPSWEFVSPMFEKKKPWVYLDLVDLWPVYGDGQNPSLKLCQRASPSTLRDAWKRVWAAGRGIPSPTNWKRQQLVMQSMSRSRQLPPFLPRIPAPQKPKSCGRASAQGPFHEDL